MRCWADRQTQNWKRRRKKRKRRRWWWRWWWKEWHSRGWKARSGFVGARRLGSDARAQLAQLRI